MALAMTSDGYDVFGKYKEEEQEYLHLDRGNMESSITPAK